MKPFRRTLSRRIGMIPGAIVEEKREGIPQAEMSLFRYDSSGAEQTVLKNTEELQRLSEEKRNLWLNISGVHDSGLLKTVVDTFGIHPIVAEDIQHTVQRPKAEEYGSQLFLLLHMLTWNSEQRSVESEQVSIITGENYVLSFQERPGDVFDAVRRRLTEGLGRVRNMGADYLAYALADAVVDNYFLVLEALQEEFEELEELVLFEDGPNPSTRVHTLTRELLSLRRAVWPMREAASAMMRGQIQAVTEEVQVFFRDIYDHIVQIIDWVEMVRDGLKGLVDTYQSKVSNSTNAVMRVLTIVSTIFIPLTFIAGIYGMNFRIMPELDWPFGYPLILGVMLLVTGGMILYFKRKKWL